VGQGWQRAGGLVAPARLRGGSYRSVFETLADSSRVQQARVTQQKLRGVLEAMGGEPCFGEDVTFDIAWDGLGISLWRLRFAAVIQVIWPETLQRLMWPRSVVEGDSGNLKSGIRVIFASVAKRTWPLFNASCRASVGSPSGCGLVCGSFVAIPLRKQSRNQS